MRLLGFGYYMREGNQPYWGTRIVILGWGAIVLTAIGALWIFATRSLAGTDTISKGGCQ